MEEKKIIRIWIKKLYGRMATDMEVESYLIKWRLGCFFATLSTQGFVLFLETILEVYNQEQRHHEAQKKTLASWQTGEHY